MIFDKVTASKLQPLLHPSVEQAIIILLEHTLRDKEQVLDNPNASDAELRAYQGQKTVLSELKQYRKRLGDTITRDKEQQENVRNNRP